MNNPFTVFLSGTGNGILLKLDLADKSARSEDITYPFVTADSSLPFTGVIRANVVTSAGAVIKEAFMTISRDDYRQYGSKLGDITNKTLDESWQRIIGKELEDENGMVLSAKADDQGMYLPFDPLFYCIEQGVYFTPVCPVCSSGFDICRDEDLLKENGLASYAGSLKRYLYCPECNKQGRTPVFYAASISGEDPANVRDKSSLIQEFVNLLVKADPNIPCPSCEYRSECYGEGWSALKNIVSLSFYPFHAVLSEPGTINALDFLLLLSGAPYEEIENSLKSRGLTGRLNALGAFKKGKGISSPLLFEGDERAFLEILYLKLSFAADLLSRIVREGEGLIYPDLALSPESIWVALPEGGGLLPSFWNFRTILIKGPEADESFQMLPDAPKSYLAYFFGRLLIYILISNPLAGRNAIDARLLKVLNTFIKGEPLDLDLTNNGIFSPENIFYRPEGMIIKEEFADIWNEAVQICISLILHGYAGDGGFPDDEFVSSLNVLKDKIMKMLFEPARFHHEIPDIIGKTKKDADDNETNARIAGILESISQKWMDYDKTALPVNEESVQEESFEKTIIITADKPAHETKIIEEPEDFHETIILNSSTLTGKIKKTAEASVQKPEPPVSEEDLLEATIIMTQNTGKVSKPPAETAKSDENKTKKPENKDDELSETVIIKK